MRQQVAAAVDLLVQVARLRDGSRRVTAIAELAGMEGETILLQDLFLFRKTGTDKSGRVLGSLEPTGLVPRFLHEAREAGEEVDFGLFQ